MPAWYLPGIHATHAEGEVEESMYSPAMQSVQKPSLDPPQPRRPPAGHKAQLVHEATFDAVEYVPTAHAVHELAPAAVPVFVIDPAAQSVQYP